jgi:hypothetical protein
MLFNSFLIKIKDISKSTLFLLFSHFNFLCHTWIHAHASYFDQVQSNLHISSLNLDTYAWYNKVGRIVRGPFTKINHSTSIWPRFLLYVPMISTEWNCVSSLVVTCLNTHINACVLTCKLSIRKNFKILFKHYQRSSKRINTRAFMWWLMQLADQI